MALVEVSAAVSREPALLLLRLTALLALKADAGVSEAPQMHRLETLAETVN